MEEDTCAARAPKACPASGRASRGARIARGLPGGTACPRARAAGRRAHHVHGLSIRPGAVTSIPHISTSNRTILGRFVQQGSSKPCQIARFSRSGHSTPMAGGSAAASVGSAVIFAPAVASRAHRHCLAAVSAPGQLWGVRWRSTSCPVVRGRLPLPLERQTGHT